MQVLYRLDHDDIVQLIAEKYEIKDLDKIQAMGLDSFLVDMSDSEKISKPPAKVLKTETARAAEEQIQELKQLKEEYPAIDITPEAMKEITKDISDKDNDSPEAMEKRYKRITEDKLKEWIEAGKKISQMCEVYDLDNRYKSRLYKRAEKYRSECASFKSGSKD